MTNSTFRKLLARVGRAANFSFLVHPHMLRHAIGSYKLANDGQDTRAIQHYLGHRNISTYRALYGVRRQALCEVLTGLRGCRGE